MLERFFDTFKERDSLLIIAHDHPDPDSISSAAALQEMAKVICKAKTTLAYGGIIGRAENAHMVKYLKLKLRHMDRIKTSKYSKIALVDTQPRTGNNSAPLKRIFQHYCVLGATSTTGNPFSMEFRQFAKLVDELKVKLPKQAKLGEIFAKAHVSSLDDDEAVDPLNPDCELTYDEVREDKRV